MGSGRPYGASIKKGVVESCTGTAHVPYDAKSIMSYEGRRRFGGKKAALDAPEVEVVSDINNPRIFDVTYMYVLFCMYISFICIYLFIV